MRMLARIEQTSSIDDHAALIREQVDRSLVDPATRKLALQIVSATFTTLPDPRTAKPTAMVDYHGRWYPLAPPGQTPHGACAARDADCEIVAVWNFLVLNCRYTGDLDGYDTYQDLRTTLQGGGGDCDDFTIAFCALLRAVGYSCAARVISLNGKHWAHVYPLVQHPGGYWVSLDATEPGKEPGWEFRGRAAERDFPMGDY